MSIVKMTDLDLKGQRVLIREDFNVPMQDGMITSDARIEASLSTIEFARNAGAKIILLSHLGRPTEGQFDPAFSLAPVADRLSKLLKTKVRLERDWLTNGVGNIENGEIVLCENVRFCVGELENDINLSRKMANLADVFVMDAFGVAHRAQASTYGVAKFAKIAAAGPLLVAELEALSRVLEAPKKPVVAIVAGSKVSTKLKLLESLLDLADQLIVGGGIANTFLAALGFPVGASLYEPKLVAEAQRILQLAKEKNTAIPLPVDVVVGKELSPSARAEIKSVNDVSSDEMILDVGPKTIKQLREVMLKAGTIIWNGPLGVFEMEPFSHGTRDLAIAIADSPAYSIAGGGDTIAAIEKFAISDKISYISTGGGAFLKCLEGKSLPSVQMLEERAEQQSVIS